jgi:translation initiation factor 1
MSDNPFDALPSDGLPPGPPAKPKPPAEPAKPKRGKLILQYERAGRGGKEVTIIKGLWIESQEMRFRDALLKDLKKALGTGGTLEAREIILQGDRRETAKAWLIKQGYTTNL